MDTEPKSDSLGEFVRYQPVAPQLSEPELAYPVEYETPVEWSAPAPAQPAPAEPPSAESSAGGSRRAARRWRFVPRSLTGRLVVGVVSLVIVLVLATGLGTYFALRSFLYDRLDQQVISITGDQKSLAHLLNSSTGDNGFQVLAVWVVVLDKNGHPTAGQPIGPEFTPLTLSEGARMALLRGTTKPVSRTTMTGAHIRLMALTQRFTQDVTDAQTGAVTSQAVTILIGLSESEVSRTMHRLVVLEWIIGASAVVLALATTGYGVRFSLRRLRLVSDTAHEVAAELSPEGAGLERRVPIEASDTAEVGRLAESMNTLLATVETQFAARVASEQQMRQFLADASHELRTPLTSIRGYAELARMEREQGTADEGAADRAADNLTRIESEGTRMSRLVDDLLTLARSDQGSPRQTEPIDIADLFADAVAGVRAAHPSRRIDVSAPPGLWVLGDRDQLLRVLRNLVTNAAVHTRPEGPIQASARRDGPWAVVTVADSGPGLPPEEAAHVFERFWRADKSRARAKGGSGLGLAIVASIVQSHGGSVRFDSSVAGGSTVTVYVPLGMG